MFDFLWAGAYLFLYLVAAGVGVATLRGLKAEDRHDWNAETGYLIGLSAVMVAWVLVTN